MTKKLEDIRKILIVDDMDDYYVYGIDKNKLPTLVHGLGLIESLFNFLKGFVKETGLSLEDIIVIEYPYFGEEGEEGESTWWKWLDRQIEEKIDIS